MKVRFKANACGLGFGYPEGIHDVPKDIADKAVKEGAGEAIEAEEPKKESKKADTKK